MVRDTSLPPSCFRQRLLAGSQALQPQLSQEEAVSRTGEPSDAKKSNLGASFNFDFL